MRQPDLAKLSRDRDVPGLIKALRYRKDPRVRQEAAAALGQLADPRAVGPLVAAFGDEDSDVRRALVKALGRIGAPAVEPLLTVLGDKQPRTRQQAAKTLGEIADRRAVEPLIRALRDHDKEVRMASAWALRQLGDARSADPLLALTEDNDQDVRFAAVCALGKLGDVRMAEPLFALTHDSDRDVRWEAVCALARLGDVRVIEPLIAFLDSERSTRKADAMELLEELGAPAVEPLIDALSGKVRYERGQVAYWAAKTLGGLADRRAVDPLITALHDQNPGVRAESAKALGNIGDLRAIEPLIAAFSGEDPEGTLGSESAKALGKIGAPAVGPLMATLGAENPNQRRWAAAALSKIGDPRALEPLIAAVEDESSGGYEHMLAALEAHPEGRPAAAQIRQEAEKDKERHRQEYRRQRCLRSFADLVAELIEIGRRTRPDGSGGYLGRTTGILPGLSPHDLTREIGTILSERPWFPGELPSDPDQYATLVEHSRSVAGDCNGDISLMLQAHREVSSALGGTRGRELEAAWGGVGQWQN